MKTLIVIQARMGSTRLPNKVMLPVAGAPLLQRMIERVKSAQENFNIVVATPFGPDEEPIRSLCRDIDIQHFDGHPTDLLDRHYTVAKEEKADVIVKIPSDCPLIDPAVIEHVLHVYEAGIPARDFVTNLHPATYPDGNDVEVLSFSVLEAAWREATKGFEREHTTPFIWERPERFNTVNVFWESGLNYSMSHRWTIDYPEDYRFVKAIYGELWTEMHLDFSLYEILALLEVKPEIHAINSRYAGVRRCTGGIIQK